MGNDVTNTPGFDINKFRDSANTTSPTTTSPSTGSPSTGIETTLPTVEGFLPAKQEKSAVRQAIEQQMLRLMGMGGPPQPSQTPTKQVTSSGPARSNPVSVEQRITQPSMYDNALETLTKFSQANNKYNDKFSKAESTREAEYSEFKKTMDDMIAKTQIERKMSPSEFFGRLAGAGKQGGQSFWQTLAAMGEIAGQMGAERDAKKEKQEALAREIMLKKVQAMMGKADSDFTTYGNLAKDADKTAIEVSQKLADLTDPVKKMKAQAEIAAHNASAANSYASANFHKMQTSMLPMEMAAKLYNSTVKAESPPHIAASLTKDALERTKNLEKYANAYNSLGDALKNSMGPNGVYGSSVFDRVSSAITQFSGRNDARSISTALQGIQTFDQLNTVIKSFGPPFSDIDLRSAKSVIGIGDQLTAQQKYKVFEYIHKKLPEQWQYDASLVRDAATNGIIPMDYATTAIKQTHNRFKKNGG